MNDQRIYYVVTRDSVYAKPFFFIDDVEAVDVLTKMYTAPFCVFRCGFFDSSLCEISSTKKPVLVYWQS